MDKAKNTTMGSPNAPSKPHKMLIQTLLNKWRWDAGKSIWKLINLFKGQKKRILLKSYKTLPEICLLVFSQKCYLNWYKTSKISDISCISLLNKPVLFSMYHLYAQNKNFYINICSLNRQKRRTNGILGILLARSTPLKSSLQYWSMA